MKQKKSLSVSARVKLFKAYVYALVLFGLYNFYKIDMPIGIVVILGILFIIFIERFTVSSEMTFLRRWILGVRGLFVGLTILIILSKVLQFFVPEVYLRYFQ